MAARCHIVTRPEADAQRLVAAVRAAGGEVISAPLLSIRFLDEVAIPPIRWQAVAITSANGARALARLGLGRDLAQVPTVVVGPASAKAAREAGLRHIVRAPRGDVQGVIAALRTMVRPDAGAVLYPSGAVTRGDLQGAMAAEGVEVVRLVTYEAVAATTLPAAVRTHLEGGGDGVVTLYSPRTAKIWTRLVHSAGLAAAAARLDHACLSENVRRALLAGLTPKGRIIVPARPDEDALLAALGLSEG